MAINIPKRDRMSFDEARNFVLPFGKHQGGRLDCIPLGYLDWLVGVERAAGKIKEALEVYLSDPSIARLVVDEIDNEERDFFRDR